MAMQTKTLTIRFLTPAFLGDAEQRGAWRTPPFKAQLRQWWRLVLAAQERDWRRIRDKEAVLFGNAWPGLEANKSQVRLRLSEWRSGKKNTWGNGSGQRSPMAIQLGRQTVDAALYLGYGPLIYNKLIKGPQLKQEPAIDAGETAELRIAWPAESADGADSIGQALTLMGRFGTVGGRSRNGWGSYVLDGAGDAAWKPFLTDWRQALETDWVRGIGADDQGPLVWRTRESYSSWEGAIRALAQIRAQVRREVSERCLMAYPVTRHALDGWGNRDRLPNSLRFKVVENGDGRLCGEIFHLPCKPADSLWEKWRKADADKKRCLINVWKDAHEYLDEENKLERLSA